MLYKTLLKLKEVSGLSEDLKKKVDVFYAAGRITDEQYFVLMDIHTEEEPIEEPIEAPVEEPEGEPESLQSI